MPSPDFSYLADAMDRRREERDLKVEEVIQRARISTQTYYDLRKGKGYPRRKTRDGLEYALSWEPGSVRDALAGKPPRPLAREPDPTPATTTQTLPQAIAPAMQPAPLGRIAGEPPCMPNETLEWRPWPIQSGRLHYTLKIVFVPPTDEDDGDWEQTSMPVPDGVPREKVVAEMRDHIMRMRFGG
ncbi:hypothetical protein [Nocardiopsis sp. YSL2]|uniref:helix-turn-helix domain-containing protein n=1 Tax=Nocardiopsis sp. YSL2 TaxID=2939492 RepID=UPI0026F44126|nr:hypothetical protein [Nocardiopsis sp. YSL2]